MDDSLLATSAWPNAATPASATTFLSESHESRWLELTSLHAGHCGGHGFSFGTSFVFDDDYSQATNAAPIARLLVSTERIKAPLSFSKQRIKVFSRLLGEAIEKLPGCDL
jgi:hypothetical protein